MLKIIQLCLISLFLTSSSANAIPVDLQIEGLSEELKKNVRAHLSTIDRSDDISSKRNLCINIDSAIREALKALGYYEPIINFDLRHHLARRRQIIIVHVVPGKPVLISDATIILRGVASTDRDYINLLNTRPKTNTVLNHGDYDFFKKKITNLSLYKGYFDSHFIKSKLNVSIERHQAFWYIEYDSGERYRFGDITFQGSQISNEYLQNLVPFKKGDYYLFCNIGELKRRLSATGWFNSVTVSQFDKKYQNKVLPLHFVVSPHIGNTIEMGIGYSTNLGPRMKAIWKKPWTNSCGHSFTTNSSISIQEQQLDFNYKIPQLKNPLEQYYMLQGGFKRTNVNKIEQISTIFALSRYWDLSNDWQRSISLRWSLDRFTQENTTNTTILLYPSFVIKRTRSGDSIIPMWGYSQRYSIEYSNSVWGSEIDFFVMQAQNVWIRTFNDKHRFIIRSNLGWIETKDFELVPPDLRFFAGGDHSIRGYEYKSISPENKKGQLTGSSKLILGSIEYQYNIRNKLWNAIFIDSGEAINNINKNNFRTGIGVGLRFQSPIGAIKFDLAIPVNEKHKHSLQFYLGLGPEL